MCLAGIFRTNAEDQVRVSGKVYGRGENTRVDVARIEEP
jgi:hypothetical protein